MKNKIFLLAFILFGTTYAQTPERTMKTEINEVTVFIEGAQITRKKTIDLKQGETILKFTNLSPFIKAKSIQVKAKGNATVLSVNHQQNYIDKLDKSKELASLENSLKSINEKIKIEKTLQEINNDEISFLKENRNIGGKNQELSLNNLKSTSSFYSSKLTELKLDNIEKGKVIKELNIERSELEKQINTLTSEKEYANGEILVKIESKNNSRVNLELSYLVDNAGWLPTYDIRAKNVNQPVELIYKANVKQDTKIDWKNVKLKLSSAEPNISGVAPELKTYILNYNTAPPIYNRSINEVSGVVLDSDGTLPGANVLVKGTTIGTSTDFDGNYSITLPKSGSNTLVFSFVGCETKEVQVTNSIHNVELSPSEAALDEVVVTAYGMKREKSILGRLKGKTSGVIEVSEFEDSEEYSIPLIKVENQTTVDFEIDMPYTILSDNKSYSVNMINYKLPADFQYYSVPKIEKEAFLIASIKDWEQYSLLEGEANIFFEDTFVGKTLLDVRYASDTLNISLGRDKNVSINREKVLDYKSKKIIGTKKEELRDWKITVKNNKSEGIKMVILDQIPVSTLDEIKVEVLEKSKGKQDDKTGEIKWNFSLDPNEKKDLNLKYQIKYPRNKNLIIE